ncbi:type-F conjugative transfer system pilin assembly protein TraF [Vibrio mediterranei]|uniref:type-F conjugative transfer system pilin assembly protein TraF n=1 Tax=Vibrio mediterranei TaxID=689 RepID=UPI0040692A29
MEHAPSPWLDSQKKAFTQICLLILILWATPTFANDAPKGWRWYNTPNQPKTPPIEKLQIPPNTVTRVMSATEQMDWFHEVYEEVKNDATINSHDEDKYLALMQLHHFIDKKTSQTGMTFKKLLLKHPDLSYTKDRPVEQAARGTYHQLEREKKVHAVHQMKEAGWGFFFVYDSNDTMSQTLAPSMQQFADTYQIELLGISEDGTFIDTIRQNRRNDGKVVVPSMPALILVNPTTSEFKPLAYGFISQNDLLGRFYNVATDYQASDF